MADQYQIAQGHNQAGSLQAVYPQPKMPGIAAGRRTEGGDHLIYQDGFRKATWHYGYMRKAWWVAFLAQAGLGEGTPSAAVTVRMPRNTERAFTNYNATIILPDLPDQAHWDATVYQDISFELIAIKEI